MSSTTRTPVVCGVTDVNYSYDDDFGKVAFNATGGYTYLIEVSDAAGGGNLALRIDKETCPTGYLCGAAVGGDGSIIRYADMEIYDAGGNYYQGYGYGDLAGFVKGYLYGGGSGNYTVGTYGNWEDGVGNTDPVTRPCMSRVITPPARWVCQKHRSPCGIHPVTRSRLIPR